MLRLIGVLLLVAGIAGLAVGTLQYPQRKHALDAGPIHIQRTGKEPVPVPPLAAGAVAAVSYSDASGQLLPSTFPGGTAFQGRARWGNTGFEGALYIGGTVGPNLNPTGSPVWVIGTPYSFEYSYDITSGNQTLKIDFNGNTNYEASEIITQNTGFAGQGFKHFSIFISGNATRGITLNNFVVNGVNLGNFVSPTTGEINKDWENSAGYFGNILATGTITFTGTGVPYGSDETGRIWLRTATPVTLPAPPTCPQN